MKERYSLDHLELRGHSYYARLNVPRDAQSLLKTSQGLPRKHFRAALDTKDRDIAKRRAAEWVVRWQAEIDSALGKAAPGDDAAYWAKALRTATDAPIVHPAQHVFNRDEPRTEREAIMERIGEAADDIAYTGSKAEANAFYGAAVNPATAAPKTDAHLERYLAKMDGRRGTKSIRMTRIALRQFAEEFPTLAAVTPAAAQEWIDKEERTKAPGTLRRIRSEVRRYWGHLALSEPLAAASDPFAKVTIQAKAKGAQKGRQPFDPAEVQQLLTLAFLNKDRELADMIRLAMYSGARLEELASLKVEHIGPDSFKVCEANELLGAKSKAGLREIPIHTELAPTLQRMIGDRTTGYLFEGLKEDRDGDFGHSLSDRFGDLKKAHGFDKTKTFHSIRKTVATMLEDADVDERIIQDILGHERSTLTGRVYSGGRKLEAKAAAIAKLAY